MTFQHQDDPAQYYESRIAFFKSEIEEILFAGLRHCHAVGEERMQDVTEKMLHVAEQSLKSHERSLALAKWVHGR